MDLIEQMAVAKWKERRGCAIHSATLNHRMNTQEDQLKAKYELLDDDMRMAIAFSTEANDFNALALLLRYEATHRRPYARVSNAWSLYRPIANKREPNNPLVS